MTTIRQEVLTAINWLDRARIVAILESYGFACYDYETNDELRESIRVNIEDGTIGEDEVYLGNS